MKKLKLLFKVFSVLTLILNLSTPVYAAADTVNISAPSASAILRAVLYTRIIWSIS